MRSEERLAGIIGRLPDGREERLECWRRNHLRSARHLALVEAVRRLYKRAAMEADRRDKVALEP